MASYRTRQTEGEAEHPPCLLGHARALFSTVAAITAIANHRPRLGSAISLIYLAPFALPGSLPDWCPRLQAVATGLAMGVAQADGTRRL